MDDDTKRTSRVARREPAVALIQCTCPLAALLLPVVDQQSGSHQFSSPGVVIFRLPKAQAFYNCIFPIAFLPWEIRVAFPGEGQLQQSRATQHRVHAGCFDVSIIHEL